MKKQKTHSQLNLFERDRIEAMFNSGHSQEDIASVLNRDASTISREISKNRRKIRTKNGTINGPYVAIVANHKAYVRRKYANYEGKKINENDELRKYIIKRLKKHWSPDEISGRMKRDNKSFYASKNLIYEWLYSEWGQYYCSYLFSHRYRPKKRKKKKTKKALIPNRIGIEMRPKEINNKQTYKHWEGDTIVSGKKTRSKTSLATAYERKAKFIRIKRIECLKPKLFNKAVESIRKENYIDSLTLDNGIENQYHEQLIGIDTYFCDPYSSWQKPGVENANGMIRRFIPKGVDISKYSHKQIKMIEDILNNKPRKSLGYKTPREIMIENNLIKKTPLRADQKVAIDG